MSSVEEVRSKVQNLLVEGLGVEPILEKGGSFRIEFSDASTAVYVVIESFGEDEVHTLVTAYSTLLREVVATPELFEWIATEGTEFRFGHAHAFKAEDGTYVVEFRYSILADYLDEEELKYAVLQTHFTADELDDELQQRFGGKRWIDAD